MKKNMKKAFASLLAATMVMSMSVTAWADNADAPTEVVPTTKNQDASFTKTYKETNEGTTSPAETFTFKFTATNVTDSNENLKISNMPSIPDATVLFNAGDAAAEPGLEKTVNVALSNVEWPGVGIYYYDVKEVASNTAGVTYDNTVAKLKVTVAYDDGTNTYYTAFVTLSLEDKDGDGKTDVKTGGFTNTYSAGKLAIKKTALGNLADRTKEFDVSVTFKVPTGLVVREPISYVEDGTTKTISVDDLADNEETVIIALKDNETITFTNIPYDVIYTVVEHNYVDEANGGYQSARYLLDSTLEKFTDENTKECLKEIKGKKIEAAETKVDIVNIKGTVVDTGILLDSAPYVLLLAIAGVGAFAVATKKREEEF